MSSHYECPECKALTWGDNEIEHKATCSQSTALAAADERIAELERQVEDLEQRLQAVEAMVVP